MKRWHSSVGWCACCESPPAPGELRFKVRRRAHILANSSLMDRAKKFRAKTKSPAWQRMPEKRGVCIRRYQPRRPRSRNSACAKLRASGQNQSRVESHPPIFPASGHNLQEQSNSCWLRGGQSEGLTGRPLITSFAER